MSWTPEKLIAFEKRVADAFLAKQIHAPVHLSGGNESQLIEIFREIRPQDWVFSTWRSHYHALLKGIPEEVLFDMICSGRSMYVMSREHRFLSSAIVGGILPIACGIAMAEKRQRTDNRVWCFVGDMTARSGIYYELCDYAINQRLPIRIVIEDNGLSTDTITTDAWGGASLGPEDVAANSSKWQHWLWMANRYKYERTWPHVGVGQKVEF